MKKIIVVILILFSSFLMGQEKKDYKFNYYTIYEYKKDSLDLEPLYEITFSNSKDNSYHFLMTLNKSNVINSVLVDIANEKKFYYNLSEMNIEDLNKNIDSKFKNSTFSKIDYKKCREKDKKSNYYLLEDLGDIFTITRFKNIKKKKVINKCYMKIVDSEFCENNFWNLQFLINPLSCGKFSINKKGIVLDSYFMIDNKKKYIRKFLKIKGSDLTITIGA